MTQDQIMKLVDAYAQKYLDGYVEAQSDFHTPARAAVVAAIETIENEVTALQDHIAEITSEEHSISELRQELLDQFEEKRKCYFAVSQYQKANQNLLEQVAALTKDAVSAERERVLDLLRELDYSPNCHLAIRIREGEIV